MAEFSTQHRFGRLIRSPYTYFCLWIVLGMGLLQLKWSLLFSPTRFDSAVFLGTSFVAFAMLTAKDSARRSGAGESSGVSRWPMIGIATYFLAAFAANGGIPVLQVLKGQPYDIYGFGVDGLHVALLSFSGFYGIKALNAHLGGLGRPQFYAFLTILVLFLSLANRSAVSFYVFAALIVYVQRKPLRGRSVAAGLGIGLVFLSVFGQFGNARLDFQIQQATGSMSSSSAIVALSRASPDFERTNLSTSWLWPYMYMASPLANLNESFRYSEGRLCGTSCNLTGLVSYQMLPDVLGKRLGEFIGAEPYDKQTFLISPSLTASTTFGSAVGYAGLLGGLAVLTELALLAALALRHFRGSRAEVEGTAIVTAILFFSFFENMIVYSPLFLQLAWAIVYSRSTSSRLNRRNREHRRELRP